MNDRAEILDCVARNARGCDRFDTDQSADRAILRATEELQAGAMVSDETWSQLSKGLDEA